MRDSADLAEHWGRLGHAAVLGLRGLCALLLAAAGLGLAGGTSAAAAYEMEIEDLSARLGFSADEVSEYSPTSRGKYVVVLHQPGRATEDWHLYSITMGDGGEVSKLSATWLTSYAVGYVLDPEEFMVMFSNRELSWRGGPTTTSYA